MASAATFHLSLLLMLLLLVFYIIYRVFLYPFFISPLRHIPGPKDHHILLGQVLNWWRSPTTTHIYEKWANTWPDSHLIRFFGPANSEVLLVNSPEAHKQLFHTHAYDFKKPGIFYRFIIEITGVGLLFAEGLHHKMQRKTILNVFSQPNVRRLYEPFQKSAHSLRQHLYQQLEKSSDGIIAMNDAFTKGLLDSAGFASLGMDLDNLNSEHREYDFLNCYMALFEQSPLSMIFSFINLYIPIRKWVPLEANRVIVRNGEEVRRIAKRLVDERTKTVMESKKNGDDGPKSRDLLTFLIEERMESKLDWSDEEVMGHLMNFLAAGHETSSGTMTWASFILATKEDIQKKLRTEIEGLLQSDPNPDFTAIDKLPYLNMFLKEILRHFSPANLTFREAMTDVDICGQLVPKGTVLAVCPNITNMSKRIWGEDAAEFRPERWANLTGLASTPWGILTFGNGPRTCIGKYYAIMLIKVMLVDLLTHFRFRPSPHLRELNGALPPLRTPWITLRPLHGMPVVVERLH